MERPILVLLANAGKFFPERLQIFRVDRKLEKYPLRDDGAASKIKTNSATSDQVRTSYGQLRKSDW